MHFFTKYEEPNVRENMENGSFQAKIVFFLFFLDRFGCRRSKGSSPLHSAKRMPWSHTHTHVCLNVKYIYILYICTKYAFVIGNIQEHHRIEPFALKNNLYKPQSK